MPHRALPKEELTAQVAKDMQPFPLLQNYLSSNVRWANDVNQAEPAFFPLVSTGQAPGMLWIGCADSRVPESVVLARRPGDIFVHRNIANQFHTDDDSALAVLTYAVQNLGVEHVVVVGHTACGGCQAAYDTPEAAITGDKFTSTPLERFLKPLAQLRHDLPAEADLNELIAQNIAMSVRNIVSTDIIQNNWEKSKQPGGPKSVWVHGWMYNLTTGLIKDLEVTQGPEGQSPPPEPPIQTPLAPQL